MTKSEKNNIHIAMRKPISAYEKANDYLSIRDHSEYELKNKLYQKGFPENEIERAIEKVNERGYLSKPEKLAEKVAESLHQKLKGILFIQEYLKAKELPSIQPDWDLEFEKAQKLALRQLKGKKLITNSIEKPLESLLDEEKQAIFRFLTNRGFTESTIFKVIKK